MAQRVTKADDAYSIGLSKGFDNGVELERARILKILRASRDAQDEVCESRQRQALDEVIHRIG